MSLGSEIKAARERKGLSQADCALILKCTQAHLSFLENDKREPNMKMLVLIHKKLDVSFNQLLLGKEEK